MDISGESILLVSSVILITGVLIGRSSYRMGLPLLLMFLIVGMLFGADGLGIQFSDMHTAQFVGMVALCIILFTGGASTAIKAIRPILAPGLVLSTAGVLVTATMTGIFIFWLSGMSWTNIHFGLIPSLLLAATMSSTDSASVFGILGPRSNSLKHNLGPMLELESGSNDPMAYMLTILLIEAVNMGNGLSGWTVIGQLFMQFGIGGGLGLGFGWLAVWLARTYVRLGKGDSNEASGQSSAMVSILTLASVFLAFTATTALSGNGYLAVYISGIIFGNARVPFRKSVSRFMDGLTWVAQIVVFIMLGLLVNPHEMLSVAAVSLLIGVFMICIGRPFSVFLCLLPFRRIDTRSKLFVSWVGLRGAVPIIFATYPVVADVPGAAWIFNIVFFVTILSLLVQGTTVIASAKHLKLLGNGAPKEDLFGVDLADGHPTSLQTIILTKEHLITCDTLQTMTLPEGALVMMIRRNNKYIIPDGKRQLLPGDALLLIKEQ